MFEQKKSSDQTAEIAHLENCGLIRESPGRISKFRPRTYIPRYVDFGSKSASC